jgi:transcriptional regulator with PAS, ATPase and Fis domain
MESELFGYEGGAFTGALKGGRTGYFEMAHGGTVFLDEIAEITLSAQAKLLRVLQEREIVRVGGTKAIRVDVRIITATNADLEDLVERGLFRKDLYYRLNVLPIHMPPLRDHLGDIDELANFMIKKFNQDYGRHVFEISRDVLEILKKYHWPGNIRELENYIGRAMINVKLGEKTLEKHHLPPILLADKGIRGGMVDLSELLGAEHHFELTLQEMLAGAEKKYLQGVLKKNEFNRSQTARALGISLRSLYYKIEKHGL